MLDRREVVNGVPVGREEGGLTDLSPSVLSHTGPGHDT